MNLSRKDGPGMSTDIQELHAVNLDDLDWQDTRFGTSFVKVLQFKDGVNFEVDRFEPGASTFRHSHGFWQMRYILEGEFIINGKKHGPGTLIDFPALTEYEVVSPTGGKWIIVQLPDPKTGYAPTDPTGKAYGAAKAEAETAA
jgi:hypothetical protein